jgi:hypothetical protein
VKVIVYARVHPSAWWSLDLCDFLSIVASLRS